MKQTSSSAVDSCDPLFLFLHIPKTGGETLNRVIFNQMRTPGFDNDPSEYLFDGVYHYPGPSQFYGFFKEPDSEVPLKARHLIATSSLTAVLGHFSFGIHRYITQPFSYIAFLRDPVERIVSLYHHLKPSITIDKFLNNYVFDEIPKFQTQLITDNDQTRRISGIEPPFGKCNEEMLIEAKRNLDRHFSVVGVTDRFDESLLVISRVLGWKKKLNYIPQNVNSSRPNVRSLHVKTIGAIKERNQLDLKLYQYASQVLDERVAGLGPEFKREVSQFIFNSNHN